MLCSGVEGAIALPTPNPYIAKMVVDGLLLTDFGNYVLHDHQSKGLCRRGGSPTDVARPCEAYRIR